MSGPPEGRDPRLDMPVEERVIAADGGPVVGRETRGLNPVVIVGAFALLAIILFMWLNARRTAQPEASLTTPSAGAVQTAAYTPPPILTPTPILLAPVDPGAIPPPPPPVLPAPVAPIPAGASGTFSLNDPASRRRAPALVVDLGTPPTPATATATGGPAVGAAALLPGAANAGRLNETEQFAQRVGEEEPDRARATAMRNPSLMVPQGAMIPGVLETAINSDLPGYTRAVVSRDVLSFDGKRVLIPRGSRLIGQYKSAVALGQSRAFIIWTRAIRPDGASIQMGSPVADSLGRGGLDGDVDRHFFRRFSGAILLSVLNAGVASLGSQPSTQISIGSAGAAQGLAGAVQGENISPTIKVPQGAAIRIFVARDLDFSGVGPA